MKVRENLDILSTISTAFWSFVVYMRFMISFTHLLNPFWRIYFFLFVKSFNTNNPKYLDGSGIIIDRYP